MLMPRQAFDAVGGFDEGFPLYAEEFDMATRLHDAGWSVRFTPVAEILHEVGVSTGGDDRPHRLVVMHSTSMYRYYAKHRAPGWRRATLPFAWLALRARAEIAWLAGKMRVTPVEGDRARRRARDASRPLTETTKKELLPLVDRPILDHTLDRLVHHGVAEVVMSSPYLEEAFAPFIETRAEIPASRGSRRPRRWARAARSCTRSRRWARTRSSR